MSTKFYRSKPSSKTMHLVFDRISSSKDVLFSTIRENVYDWRQSSAPILSLFLPPVFFLLIRFLFGWRSWKKEKKFALNLFSKRKFIFYFSLFFLFSSIRWYRYFSFFAVRKQLIETNVELILESSVYPSVIVADVTRVGDVRSIEDDVCGGVQIVFYKITNISSTMKFTFLPNFPLNKVNYIIE